MRVSPLRAAPACAALLACAYAAVAHAGDGAAAAVVLAPEGLDAAQAALLAAHVDREVARAGVQLHALPDGVSVTPGCIDDPRCVQALQRAALVSRLLWLGTQRAGGKLRVEARLFDDEGAVARSARHIIEAEVLSHQGARVVPLEVLEQLAVGALPARPRVDPPPAEPADDDPAVANADRSTRTLAGVAAIAAGIVVGATCLAFVPAQVDVLYDASSLGGEKEIAGRVAPALVVVGAAAVLGGLIGGTWVLLAE